MNSIEIDRESQDVGSCVHWFRVTVHPVDGQGSQDRQLMFMMDEILKDMGQEPVWFTMDHGRCGYRKGVQEQGSGITILWDMSAPGVGACCTVDIPGKGCDVLGFEGLKTFDVRVRALDAVDRVNVKRLDVAMDTREVTPLEVWENYERSDFSCQCQRKSIHERTDHAGDMTVYFGSRTSGRYLKIYDQRGPTRIELTMCSGRTEWGNEGWSMLLKKGVSAIPGLIRDYIDWDDWEPWDDTMQDVSKLRVKGSRSLRDCAMERMQSGIKWVEECASAIRKYLEVMCHVEDKHLSQVVDRVLAHGEKGIGFRDQCEIAAATGNPVSAVSLAGGSGGPRNRCPF